MKKKVKIKITLHTGEVFKFNRLKEEEEDRKADEQVQQFEQSTVDGEIGILVRNSFGY